MKSEKSIQQGKRKKLIPEDNSSDSDIEVRHLDDLHRESDAPVAGTSQEVVGKLPKSFSEKFVIDWSIEDVRSFIKSTDEFKKYADDFRAQEIDGKALLLLNVEHFFNFMKMNLGPAVKFEACVKNMQKKYPL